MIYQEALSINLKKYREAESLTKCTLAKRLGMMQPHLTQIEKGKVGVSLSTLERMCDYFECTPNDLLLDSESGL